MKICVRTLTASLALLGLTGAGALAQQSTDQTTTPPAQQTEQQRQEGQTGTMGATGTAQQGTTAGDTMATDRQRYESFEAHRDSFQGSIAGDYTADELIGKDVVGPDDETVGSISDLLIDQDNQVNQVILDVGGFLGMGTRNVAVDIAQLERGDDEDELRINMTREQVEDLPEHDRDDDGWFSM